MKILICGANGLVGHHVIDDLMRSDHQLIAIARNNINLFDRRVKFIALDLTEFDKLLTILNEEKPDCIINCAAFTHVDNCEIQINESLMLNKELPELLASFCEKFDSHLIHISTDYIYDGNSGPYSEIDHVNPLSAYGNGKLEGDLAIIDKSNLRYTIFRAIVIFGYHRDKSKLNYVTWVIDQLKSKKDINIVTDQSGNYTYVNDLAKMIIKSINSHYGIFNISGDYYASRYEFTIKIAEILGFDRHLVHPILTKDLNQKAKRPMKSGLKNLKAKEELNFKPIAIENTLLEINKLLI